MSKKVLYEVPDISNFQGNVNFKSMRDAGYKAVLLRAGWGQNNRDQKYESNAQACANLNIPAGIYWFSYALDEQAVLREADYAIKAAKEFWKTCPIAFDLEYDSRNYAAKKGIKMDKTMCTKHAKLFLNAVKEAGFTPVLYLNRDYWNNYFNVSEILNAVPSTLIWFAYYSDNEPSEISKADIWQYTSKGKIPGINGNVDVNKVYTELFNDYIKPASSKNQKCNVHIQEFQSACNCDGYRDMDGKKLEIDGIDGLRTQYARKQIALKAKWTVFGYKMGSVGIVVKWMQGRLHDIGYKIDVDGKYGGDTRKVVMAYQKDYGLTVDGVAGYNTLQSLFYN